MNTPDARTPVHLAQVAAAALQATLQAEPHAAPQALRYLRRKPGRGLVAVYASVPDGRPSYTVTAPEDDLTGPTIERFPVDRGLPELTRAMALTGQTVAVLAAAAGLGQVARVEAVALRYKPGDRCVIRYHLASSDGRAATVVAKLYRSVEQAEAAARLGSRLWSATGGRWAPRTVGVALPLPLVLTEDVGSASSAVPVHQGTDVIRFGAVTPVEALSSAARALAELHTSPHLPLPGTPVRAAGDEGVKARRRGGVVAGHVPELATSALEVSSEVSSALAGLGQVACRPSHGSYKPSQLLYREGRVFIVDFDQFALADPALDVGYFLAYLRPPGLWYRRPGTRDWFSFAAATFLDAYAACAADRGMSPDEVEAVLRRCHVYEAALLLKIAARRANRLHSPRPAEVRAILAEARACLEAAGRR